VFQFSSPRQALANNQTHFYALKLDARESSQDIIEDLQVESYPISVAEEDGTLTHLASTYSAGNDTITHGLSRQGTRLVSFAPLLQQDDFPLGQIIDSLLQIGSWGMGTPVEMEFAVNLSPPPGSSREFALLQIRPLAATTHSLDDTDLHDSNQEGAFCRSNQVLGNGVIPTITDIIVVRPESFNRSRTKEVAREIMVLNDKLMREGRPYLLIGPGRWGSLDPWLGIPVKWEQICGARAVVECGFQDIDVAPSQGSHFFQNITSFQVAYFTVTSRVGEGEIDWDWLGQFQPEERMEHAQHIRFDAPLLIMVNGHRHQGVILKPGHVPEDGGL
jgi:hypothetical protein